MYILINDDNYSVQHMSSLMINLWIDSHILALNLCCLLMDLHKEDGI